MEHRRVPDFNRVCVWCMSAMTRLHVEAKRDCPFDKIAMLVQSMDMVANARNTS